MNEREGFDALFYHSLVILQDPRCRAVMFNGSVDYAGCVFTKALDLQGDKAPMQLRELYQVGYVFLEWLYRF